MRQSFEQKPEEAWEAEPAWDWSWVQQPQALARRQALSMFVAEWPTGHLCHSSACSQDSARWLGMCLKSFSLMPFCWKRHQDRNTWSHRVLLLSYLIDCFKVGGLVVYLPYTCYFFFLKESLPHSRGWSLKTQFIRMEEKNQVLEIISCSSVFSNLHLYIWPRAKATRLPGGVSIW